MKILLEGLKKFSSEIYPAQQTLFKELVKGQTPHTLFITCSDSRIDPNLITQTDPGELFVIRNAGNIIPPYGVSQGGEEAAIEFAVAGLNIKNIVICGHSHCGAMAALFDPASIHSLPSMKRWLDFAESTRRRCLELNPTQSMEEIIGENVLVQIENLKTHPSVSTAIRHKKISLFGWVYHFETGCASIYDPKTNRFAPSLEIKMRNEADLLSFAL